MSYVYKRALCSSNMQVLLANFTLNGKLSFRLPQYSADNIMRFILKGFIMEFKRKKNEFLFFLTENHGKRVDTYVYTVYVILEFFCCCCKIFNLQKFKQRKSVCLSFTLQLKNLHIISLCRVFTHSLRPKWKMENGQKIVYCSNVFAMLKYINKRNKYYMYVTIMSGTTP